MPVICVKAHRVIQSFLCYYNYIILAASFLIASAPTSLPSNIPVNKGYFLNSKTKLLKSENKEF